MTSFLINAVVTTLSLSFSSTFAMPQNNLHSLSISIVLSLKSSKHHDISKPPFSSEH
jgi:hypothetical protein